MRSWPIGQGDSQARLARREHEPTSATSEAASELPRAKWSQARANHSRLGSFQTRCNGRIGCISMFFMRHLSEDHCYL